MPSWAPIAFVAGVILLFAVGALHVWRYGSSLSAEESWADREQIEFRTPALVKMRLWSGLWSTKTLLGMEIRVGPGFVWVTTSIDGMADALGSQWFYSVKDCAVDLLTPPKAPLHRSWVVFEGASGNRRAKVAVSPDDGVASVREALVAAGFTVSGLPGTGA